ncbi:MAG: cytochrome-c peroxidase [Caulobacteraceae bacterium]
MIRIGQTMLAAAAAMAVFCASAALAALPPVPAPAENPITEPKRVLGKILFWDEQLSSDNTVACGTCHRPGKGGGDPRQGRHPGADGVLGTDDDTFGSPGVPHMDKAGIAREHKIFGMKPQVGDRTAPSNFGNIWSDFMFWDGRAGPKVVDPNTGKTVIRTGGALENQALGPLQNPAEMAKETRGWADLSEKLRLARPLALATRLPPDTAAAIKARPTYPDLFRQAFGDPKIDAVRVAEAIATYERTLVPDQTPYDLATAPGMPVDPEIQRGMLLLDTAHCTACHKPPLFTDNKFHNVGLRRPYQDAGRGKISGDPADNGRFKTPTLRNSALRASFMHTGEFTDLRKVLDHYVTPKADADPLPGTDQPYKTTIEDSQRQQIIDFLATDLTDPRVAAEQFPFDRPILRSERQAGQGTPGRPEDFKARFDGGVVKLTWRAPKSGAEDYVLIRDGRVIGLPTQTAFEDDGQTPWLRHRYRLVARNDAAAPSLPTSAGAGVPSLELAGGAVVLAAVGGFWLWRRKQAA